MAKERKIADDKRDLLKRATLRRLGRLHEKPKPTPPVSRQDVDNARDEERAEMWQRYIAAARDLAPSESRKRWVEYANDMTVSQDERDRRASFL